MEQENHKFIIERTEASNYIEYIFNPHPIAPIFPHRPRFLNDFDSLVRNVLCNNSFCTVFALYLDAHIYPNHKIT